MAIYHTRVKVFSRSKGHSAVAAAAYRAGLALLDKMTGVRHDYTRRGGVVANLCLAPKGAPEWAIDPTRVWGAAQDAERRKDAALAREFEISLPHELDDAQRLKLVEAIGQALIDRYGFAIQASIHAPDPPDGLNHHCHFLATTRRMGESGLGEKTRELDGGAEGRRQVEWVRALVAEKINEHLERAGQTERVDHRRLDVQALDALSRGDLESAARLSRRPTLHEGKAATAARKRGAITERREVNDSIKRANADRLEDRLAQLRREGRLMSTPAGHSHAAAVSERRAQVALPTTRPQAPISDLASTVRFAASVRKVSYRTGDKVADTLAMEQREREAEIERLMLECARIYLDNLNASLRAVLRGMASILLEPKAISQFHGSSRRLLSDVKDLHGAMVRAERDTSRFRRRMAIQDRAEHDLSSAKLELDQFDTDQPKAGLWTKREWAERRRRKAERVADLSQACAEATAATNPAAQVRYKRKADESLHALAWAGKQFASNYLMQLSSSLSLPEETASDELDEELSGAKKKGRRRVSQKPGVQVPPPAKFIPGTGPRARI